MRLLAEVLDRRLSWGYAAAGRGCVEVSGGDGAAAVGKDRRVQAPMVRGPALEHKPGPLKPLPPATPLPGGGGPVPRPATPLSSWATRRPACSVGQCRKRPCDRRCDTARSPGRHRPTAHRRPGGCGRQRPPRRTGRRPTPDARAAPDHRRRSEVRRATATNTVPAGSGRSTPLPPSRLRATAATSLATGRVHRRAVPTAGL